MRRILSRAVLGAVVLVAAETPSALAGPASPIQVEPGWDWTATGPYGAEVTALAASPVNGDLLFVASARGSLFRSMNGGAQWSRCGQTMPGGPIPPAVTCVAFDPENPAVVYAGTRGGALFRSTDRGREWSPLATADRGDAILAIAVHPRRNRLILLATTGGILRSTDGGETFSAARVQAPPGSTVTQPLARAFAFDPFRPAHAYAATLAFGLLRSEDGGETFSAHGNGPSGLEGIDLDPTNGQILFGYTSRQALKSLDGGLTWSRLPIEASPAPRFTALALDRDRPDRVALATASGRVFVSEDGGLTWKEACNGALPGPVTGLEFRGSEGLLAATACCPALIGREGRVSVRTAGLDEVTVRALLPCGTGFGRIIAGTDLGLYESRDYGFTWSLLDAPLATGKRGVNVLAAHPSRPQVLLAGTDAGIIWTEDDGLTWKRALDDVAVSGLAPLPGDGVHVWVAGVRKSETILFRGDAASASWTTIRTEGGIELPWVRAHPRRPDRLFLGGRTLLATDDAGMSWSPAFGISGVRDLAFDPFDPMHAYAATAFGIAETRDGGETWDTGEMRASDVVSLNASVSAPGLVVAAASDGAYVQRSAGGDWGFASIPGAGDALDASLDASGGVLYVGGVRGVFRSAVPVPETPELRAVRCNPNPFRGATRIAADAGSAEVLGISIYSVGGGLIRTVHFSPPLSSARWDWDGRTDFGEEAASGLYLVVMHTASADLSGKVVKLQ